MTHHQLGQTLKNNKLAVDNWFPITALLLSFFPVDAIGGSQAKAIKDFMRLHDRAALSFKAGDIINVSNIRLTYYNGFQFNRVPLID